MTVIAVFGVSGSGKSYLINSLCENSRFKRVPSVTTRSPRRGELAGIDKVFLSDADFDAWLEAGRLLCPAVNFGARYGHDKVALQTASGIPVVEIAAQSIAELRAELDDVLVVEICPGTRAAESQ